MIMLMVDDFYINIKTFMVCHHDMFFIEDHNL